MVPGYLEAVFDPNFKVEITRITGDSGAPLYEKGGAIWPADHVHHQYSSAQAWNADGSLIWLRLGGVLVDAKTLKPSRFQRPENNYVEQWSPVEPETMFFFKDNILYKYNVRTYDEKSVMSAPGYSDLRMEVRTSPSNDGLSIGAKATRLSDGKEVCLLLDLTDGSVSKPIVFEDYGFTNRRAKARRCGASPSGRYVWIDGYTTDHMANNIHFFDREGNLVSRINQNAGVECTSDHGDLGLDAHGDDVFVGVCKRGPGILSVLYGGQTISFRAKDGVMKGLGPWFSHYSCRNTRRPGYCFGSTYGSVNSTVAAINLDGLGIEYITNTYANSENDYWAQPQAVPSPSGNKIIFASNWNEELPKAHIFMVDFSQYCY